MIIAISGDGLIDFTCGFPPRGMLIYLVDLRKNDSFEIFYTKSLTNELLADYFNELHAKPNVKATFLTGKRTKVIWNRINGKANYIDLNGFDIFINPAFLEFHTRFKGPQIGNVTDLSIIKNQSTLSHPRLRRLLDIRMKRFLLRQSNYNIVSISEYTHKDILETFPDIKAQIRVLHNGIADFWFDESDNVTLSPELDFGLYFIWWGNVSRRKNITRLVKVFSQMRSQNQSMPRLLIVGSLAEHVKGELIPLLKNNPHVSQIPFQSDSIIKSLVKNSQGLIFPSHYEGFGLPVIEAFSQGVPVACANNTSLPEIAGGHAILFNENSDEEMAHAILKLWQTGKENTLTLKSYSKKFKYSSCAQYYNKLINLL